MATTEPTMVPRERWTVAYWADEIHPAHWRTIRRVYRLLRHGYDRAHARAVTEQLISDIAWSSYVGSK